MAKREFIVYHYTTVSKLLKILKSEAIMPTSTNIPPGEKPVVWFSSNLDYEPTAVKAVLNDGKRRQLTVDETEQLGGGLARIGVKRCHIPYDWKTIKQVARIQGAQALAISAQSMGSNVCYFYGALEPIGIDLWHSIEIRDPKTKSWVDKSLTE